MYFILSKVNMILNKTKLASYLYNRENIRSANFILSNIVKIITSVLLSTFKNSV